MIVTTSSHIQGKKIVETFGLVIGSTTRAEWLGNELVSKLRKFVGGEFLEYTEMLSDAREEAIQRMIAEAKQLGANAVVDMRFSTAQAMPNAVEILAYGTAIKARKAAK